MQTKLCDYCKEHRPVGEYQNHPAMPDRKHYLCRGCVTKRLIAQTMVTKCNELERLRKSEDKKARVKKHRDPKIVSYVRKYNLEKAYGLTEADYELMLRDQGGKCLICGIEQSLTRNNRLNVDHDHSSGKVRGLLCGRCNTGLGMFGDSTVRVERALAYLEYWNWEHGSCATCG